MGSRFRDMTQKKDESTDRKADANWDDRGIQGFGVQELGK